MAQLLNTSLGRPEAARSADRQNAKLSDHSTDTEFTGPKVQRDNTTGFH
jgi:hypothetical protein